MLQFISEVVLLISLNDVVHVDALVPRRYVRWFRLDDDAWFWNLILFGLSCFPFDLTLDFLGLSNQGCLLEGFFDVESEIVLEAFNCIEDSELHLTDVFLNFFRRGF